MAIRVRDLAKSYGRIEALKGIDLDIEGGMFGLLGPNGAGKTTLMRILVGLLRPTRGTATVFGHPLEETHAIRRMLGYLPQTFGFYPQLSAYQAVDYLAVLRGVELSRHEIMGLLERVGLAEVAYRKTATFSRGMLQRLGIATALAGNPKLLVVDEPTAGLDPEARVGFRNLIASLAGDRTIVLSTHIVADVESTCSDLAVLHSGTILFNGPPSQLVSQARGRVWDLTIPNDLIASYTARYMVTRILRGPKMSELRLLAATPPEAAVEAEPSLEDSYIWLIGGLSTSEKVLSRGERAE
ncbi:MAG: ABC transporter ATP-binding protein [Clostridia bacterium]